MNIRCPECQTTFRVDPARIPAGGVRARCSRCNATFVIDAGGLASSSTAPSIAPAQTSHAASERPGHDQPNAGQIAAPSDGAKVANQSVPPAAAATLAAGPDATGSGPSSNDTAAPPPGAQHTPAAQQGSAPKAPAAQQETSSRPSPIAAAPASGKAPVEGAARAPVFGSRDPKARAQRIARALVSDIVAYHPKRRDACLEAGTLRTEFRDEIMKSWEEYVAQVGLDMAKSTPFFRDALNAILAKGQAVF